MEDIIEKERFCFKGIVMSGNPLKKSGEVRKLLGLRWDTEKDEMSVVVKLKYEEKIKEAYAEEDPDLVIRKSIC
jgi:hypothetical protein